jgi:hypothetical protein
MDRTVTFQLESTGRLTVGRNITLTLSENTKFTKFIRWETCKLCKVDTRIYSRPFKDL